MSVPEFSYCYACKDTVEIKRSGEFANCGRCGVYLPDVGGPIEKEKDSMLEINVERMHRTTGQGAKKAFADVTLEVDPGSGSLDGPIELKMTIKGFSVVESSNGTFVSMPRQEGKDKKWFDIVRCSPALKQRIEDAVMAEYNKGGSPAPVEQAREFKDEDVPF